MWHKLPMSERARIMKMAVESGITDLPTIRRSYNRYAEGGYLDWVEAVKKWRPNIDIDAQEPTYDYEGFYNEDPDYAWDMLKGDSEAHFTDRYKLPNHPTFSNESKYSTPETPGGTWEEYGGRGVFRHSPYTEKHKQETREYLENTGEGYLEGLNAIFPKRRKYWDGGVFGVSPEDIPVEARAYMANGDQQAYQQYLAEQQAKESHAHENLNEFMSYMPIVGTAMDIVDFADNPSIEGGIFAGASLLSDIFGGKWATSLAKAGKAGKVLTRSKPLYNTPAGRTAMGATLFTGDAAVNSVQNDYNERKKKAK